MRINSISDVSARRNMNVTKMSKVVTQPSFYGYRENYIGVLENTIKKGHTGLPIPKDVLLDGISKLINAAKEFPSYNKSPFFDSVIANTEYYKNPWQLLVDLKFESGGPIARRFTTEAMKNYIYPLVKDSQGKTCVGLEYDGDHMFSGHKHKFQLLFLNPDNEKGLSIWLSRNDLFNYGEIGHQSYRTYYNDYSWCEWNERSWDSYPSGTM